MITHQVDLCLAVCSTDVLNNFLDLALDGIDAPTLHDSFKCVKAGCQPSQGIAHFHSHHFLSDKGGGAAKRVIAKA